MGVIGDTLSEARTRRGVDLDGVHAATGIRPRYLRAIEQEDWDALPEEFYARSFIRKYAQFLEVEPEPLVAEYRRQRGTSGGRGAPTTPFAGTTTSRRAEALRRRRARQGVYAWLGGIAVLIVIAVAVILLVADGGEEEGAKQAGGGSPKAKSQPAKKKSQPPSEKTHRSTEPRNVALKIEPTAEVWACVLDAKGKPLVDGATLAAGETSGPFHSRSYTAAFGNGSVEVWVDGKPAHTPSTPNPMGFTVNRQGKVHAIAEGERPSCE